jgi:predicted transcriptional regulator
MFWYLPELNSHGSGYSTNRHRVVYNGVMSRTQVYLGDEELELLDQAAQATGASRSALIRRAVRESFGAKTKADKIRALQASAGSWKGRSFTGAEYVDAIRGDLNDRLRQLGLQ